MRTLMTSCVYHLLTLITLASTLPTLDPCGLGMGIPGAVYFCPLPNWAPDPATGQQCIWQRPATENQCIHFGDNSRPKSIGPDPGGYCVFYASDWCKGEPVTLEVRGKGKGSKVSCPGVVDAGDTNWFKSFACGPIYVKQIPRLPPTRRKEHNINDNLLSEMRRRSKKAAGYMMKSLDTSRKALTCSRGHDSVMKGGFSGCSSDGVLSPMSVQILEDSHKSNMVEWIKERRRIVSSGDHGLSMRPTVLGETPTPDPDIMMQDFSTMATVAAITAQIGKWVSEGERIDLLVADCGAPEAVLFRMLEDYVLVNPVQLPMPATAPNSKFRQKARKALAMFKKNPVKLSAVIATGVFYFGIGLGYQVIALYTSRIVGNEIACSSNSKAGAWFPDVQNPILMANVSIFPAINDSQTDLVFKAVKYADNCYKKDYIEEECSLFYSNKIDSTEQHNATCPFSKDLCPRVRHTAFDLDTGWQYASNLGVNDNHVAQFRMRKICSPLNLEQYIRSRVLDDHGTKYVEYMLGDASGIVQHGDKTFGEQSTRRLIPKLQVPGSRVSLYFVRPVNIAYTRPSSDPVFPATVSSGPGKVNGKPLYINALQYSTAFACADTFVYTTPKAQAGMAAALPKPDNAARLAMEEPKRDD
ncbi:hypothetical protein EK21DRAFT_93838 [Setomelanomma holmii]|uniref:Uncharacterized protein n=1 Tax=Setomelanomma holmii TaxID=210430 RepID=A0A9P4GXZ6_9PLEO|nr:hypothetical protein EK21DRAFT_93838 [Setomelanomma holmii]